MVSAHARRGKRLRAIVAQSRDCVTIVRNLDLEIERNMTICCVCGLMGQNWAAANVA